MSSNSEKFVTEDQVEEMVRAVREGLTPGRDQKVAVFSLSHGGKSKDPIWTGYLSHIPRVGEQITCTATSPLAGGIFLNRGYRAQHPPRPRNRYHRDHRPLERKESRQAIPPPVLRLSPN